MLVCKCHEEARLGRIERNSALNLAQHYRDVAETIQKEKRDLKKEMEDKIELVKSFWRDKVVEGGTRSGKLLRAALLRK